MTDHSVATGGMTTEEWGHMLRIASGAWNDRRLLEDEPGAAFWYVSLSRYPARIVFSAISDLAQNTPRFPVLAELLAECDRAVEAAKSAAAAAERPKLPAPRERWGHQLALPDGYVVGPCSALFAEMNAEGPWPAERMAEFCRRAAAVMATTPERGGLGLSAAMAGLAEHAIPLGGQDRAVPQETPVVEVREEAKRIADQWQQDPTSVDPNHLPPNLRAAVRAELIHRRRVAVTTEATS